MVADLLRIISGDQALKSALPAADDGRFFDATNRVRHHPDTRLRLTERGSPRTLSATEALAHLSHSVAARV